MVELSGWERWRGGSLISGVWEDGEYPDGVVEDWPQAQPCLQADIESDSTLIDVAGWDGVLISAWLGGTISVEVESAQLTSLLALYHASSVAGTEYIPAIYTITAGMANLATAMPPAFGAGSSLVNEGGRWMGTVTQGSTYNGSPAYPAINTLWLAQQVVSVTPPFTYPVSEGTSEPFLRGLTMVPTMGAAKMAYRVFSGSLLGTGGTVTDVEFGLVFQRVRWSTAARGSAVVPTS